VSRLVELSKACLGKALGISFYRHKEVTQLYTWGCSYALTWTAEKCLSPVEVWLAVWPGRRGGLEVYVLLTFLRLCRELRTVDVMGACRESSLPVTGVI
jgi:hypothetical protein